MGVLRHSNAVVREKIWKQLLTQHENKIKIISLITLTITFFLCPLPPTLTQHLSTLSAQGRSMPVAVSQAPAVENRSSLGPASRVVKSQPAVLHARARRYKILLVKK